MATSRRVPRAIDRAHGVTTGGRTHPDFGEPFPTWTSFHVHDHWPPEKHVDSAATTVQSMAFAFIWRRTGIGGWPTCPIHGSHPLWSCSEEGIAVWQCRLAGYRVPIGQLPDG